MKTKRIDRDILSDDSDCDLLKHLDVGFRREQWRESRKQNRASKKMKMKRDRGVFLKPVSSDDQSYCMNNLREALGAEGLDETVCCVCDRLVLARDTVRKEGSDRRFMTTLRNVLGVFDESIPSRLVDQYRASPCVDGLENVLVSPEGIHCYKDDDGFLSSWMSICSDCMSSIRAEHIPKFAIANGFCVGRLPKALRELTIPERFMTQTTSLAAITRVMRGGRHRCIRSHCLAFDCTPGPPVSLLPQSIDAVSSYRVVMVGDFTGDQMAKVKKMHRIRKQKVKDVFKFYQDYNHLYKDVLRCDDALNTEYPDEVVDEYFIDHVQDNSGALDESISAEMESVRGQSDDWKVKQNDERLVLERRVGLMDDTSGVPASYIAEVDGGPSTDRKFMVRRSNKFANDMNGDLFAKLFPHLFPFGRGHPGDHRRTPVSLNEAIKHYISLSGRQFAEDELFTLVAFDRLALQNMYIQNSVRCKRFPHLFNGYESIGVEQLGRALIANERRIQGCLPRAERVDSVAARFLNSVEIASHAVWGSNAERSQCRQKAFAYQARFGQPALFVTLTPNADNSFAMAQYTGISSVDSLFDVLEARMPSKAELREASLGNDCASARLFMRHVDAFIRFVLGVDPKSKLPNRRGLFGDVEAYFGMVETQGRGTLHIHFLIWLHDGPCNSAAVDAMLSSDDARSFCESVEKYTASIVSNTIPLDLSDHRCCGCGAGLAQMTALPTPDLARKDPREGLYNARAKLQVSEPSLYECNICKIKFSSQHLLRSVLLQQRPPHWPHWGDEYSTSDMLIQARRELRGRDTLKSAIHIVEERELMEACARDGGNLATGFNTSDVGTIDWLDHLNCPRMRFCKSDDDPFQNDCLTRLIEMLPPSTSDARIPQTSIDYMVSSLVLLLNQHWWCHATTCFKQSRATPDASFCRYGFPKERVPRTNFTAAGVEISRPLGHEFVNGFNAVIMATFKCNHDIQVLIGGQEATHRIHYCCKYVTKQQKRLDSVVATALGAFKRRQEREQLENTPLSGGLKDDNTSIARKRVASIVYSTTNRQEIAGPLAALYLYRGSCCYSSATCTTLPLGDIIHQLCASEDYACRLIRESSEDGALKYRAVSNLDDYLYRPDSLSKFNLYEFSMHYFRKKDKQAQEAKLAFMCDHPLYLTHSLGRRFREVVPVIRGYRMPYVDTESSLEYQVKHAMLSLVLFKPFRSVSDLVHEYAVSDEGWVHAYSMWERSRSEFVKRIMCNMDDYYSGLKYAKDQRTAIGPSSVSVPHNEEEDDSITVNDDDGFYDADNFLGIELYDELIDENDELIDIWRLVDDDNIIIESSSLHPSVCPSAALPECRVTPILGTFASLNMLQGAAKRTATEASKIPPIAGLGSIAQLRKWIGDATTDNSLIARSHEILDVRVMEVVELLENTLNEENMVWHPESVEQSHTPRAVTQCSSITTVSRAFTLNRKQHYAFRKIGVALLSRWRNLESSSYANADFERALGADQLLMFLGGEGGTGKSRVVEAVQTFCGSWGRSSCLVKTALTGKAATLIGGRTLESFLLQLKGKTATEAAMDLDLLIIDEVSMMKKLQLVQLDCRLRIVKRLPQVRFGGIHVVLVGDFLQLPPVGADPIYRDPSLRTKSTATDFTGFQLWREFEDVIVLDESVRFQNDPEWGDGCRNARMGIWTEGFVALINARVISRKSDSLVQWIASDERTTFVTPDNTTRLSINNLFISTAAKYLPDDIYPVRVVANFKGTLRGLSSTDVKMIMSLPDSKFGRMAPYLDLVIGMPIQITQNIRPQKMVANGSLGTLESVVYAPNTTFRVVHDSVADIFVKVPSEPPTAVIVRLQRGDCASPMLGSTDSDLFPLFFSTQAFKQCEIALEGTHHGCRRVLSTRIQQFPLVCAVASTIYKVQGETLSRMVVTEWRSKNAAANKREQPYLLVSRVTSRYALLALSPLTPEIIQWAHPPTDALQEEERLRRLSDRTLSIMV